MPVSLSKTAKLDGVRSWSLLALKTCPGSVSAKGTLVDACSGCYAVGGNYRFSNVIKPRLENQTDWERDAWVQDMVDALRNERYFRWFDSGDMYSIKLAEKIYKVMQQTPDVKHWLPTRMRKFTKFHAVLDRMQALTNVMVRFSSDSIRGEFIPGLHGSTIAPSIDSIPEGSVMCSAAVNDGKCGACRKCYDKSVSVVAYVAHGRVMQKLIAKG